MNKLHGELIEDLHKFNLLEQEYVQANIPKDQAVMVNGKTGNRIKQMYASKHDPQVQRREQERHEQEAGSSGGQGQQKPEDPPLNPKAEMVVQAGGTYGEYLRSHGVNPKDLPRIPKDGRELHRVVELATTQGIDSAKDFLTQGNADDFDGLANARTSHLARVESINNEYLSDLERFSKLPLPKN